MPDFLPATNQTEECMTTLSTYNQFSGRHWETGTVANHLAFRGVTAPHTGSPYSEAFFLGASGGVVMGYFSFAYEGHDPMARILTRNTFDPWTTMLSRLGVAQEIHHTASSNKAVTNLVDALDDGLPPIVWADMFSLPYNALDAGTDMWGMMPIVVYGYDETAGSAWIADRARLGLNCKTSELAAARGRVKKDKHRLITLEAPDESKLVAAATAGIWDCIRLYTEAPPKGTPKNFGLAAFRNWAELLTNPKARLSWAKVFPPGREMVAGLMSAYSDIRHFGKDGWADRDTYADCLDEAAVLLERPALGEAASAFRATVPAWEAVGAALLPDDVAALGELRALMDHDHQLFLNEGSAALPQRREGQLRLEALTAELATDFPLDDAQVVAFRERLAERILALHDREEAAVQALREAMS